jgi:hypothetical protein
MTEAIATKPKKQEVRRYTEDQIQRALIEVAACSGNTRQAARNLAEDGLKIHPSTLWSWSTRELVEKYERLRQEALPAITAQATEQHMSLARRQMAISHQAADLVAQRLPNMEDKDLVNAMGKADIGSGIHTEKAQLLAGQPTQIVSKSSQELIRELEAEGLKLDAIDAEVVSEEDVTTA